MEAALPLLLGRKKEVLQGNQKVEIHSVEIRHPEGPKIIINCLQNLLEKLFVYPGGRRKTFPLPFYVSYL